MQRNKAIRSLGNVGYDVGTRNIVRLQGQTLEDLTNNFVLLHQLPRSMKSTTIFIAAENSDFADMPVGNPRHTLNMIALMRI